MPQLFLPAGNDKENVKEGGEVITAVAGKLGEVIIIIIIILLFF